MDTSFQNLKEKFNFNSQKLIERKLKATCVKNSLNEITDKSNFKLLALKKALKVKMDEKKKEKYEKRILMYKIANEEIDEYEKFFDEEDINEEDFNEENIKSEGDNEEKTDEKDINDVDDDNIDEENINEDNIEEDIDLGSVNDETSQKNNFNENSNDAESNKIERNYLNKDNVLDENSENEIYSKNLESGLEEKMDLGLNFNEDKKNQNLDCILNMNQSCLDNEELLGLCSAKVVDTSKILIDNDENSIRLSFDKEPDLSSQETSFFKDNNLKESQKSSQSSNSRENFNKKCNFDEDSASEDEISFANKISNKFKNKKLIEEDSDDDSNFEKDSDNESENNSQSNLPSDDEENLSQKINFNNSNFDNSKMLQTNTSSQIVSNKPINIKDFIDDQAELSDEDQDKVSSDEDDNSEDEYEQDEIAEDLPSEDQIYKQNNKIFLKQQIDEDKREILEYQERFLKFGDLENNGESRQRKFKWKNVDNVWLDNLKDSSDSDEFDFDESEIGYTSLHLKNLEEISNRKKTDLNENCEDEKNDKNVLTEEEKNNKKLHDASLNKSHLNIYSTFDDNLFSKHAKSLKKNFISGPKNDIQSYIIKDKSLVDAMSIKTSINTKNKNRVEARPVNKKRKVDHKKPPRKSIFDLF